MNYFELTLGAIALLINIYLSINPPSHDLTTQLFWIRPVVHNRTYA